MTPRGVEAFLNRQRAAGGVYRELHPAPDLAAVVACGWIGVVRHGAGAPAAVIPDGCADIITCDDQAPVVVGPDTEARRPALPDGTVITGLRLRPGALRSVVGCPAVELVDTSVGLVDLASNGRRLHANLLSADTLRGRLILLEQWVRDRVRIESGDRAVIGACRTLMARPHTGIAGLAAELGWNQRKLHREFRATCGYGPKIMQRILRVQQVMRLTHRPGRPLPLSAVAAASGFADQAHMTREFRALTGSTPVSFLAQSEPGLSRWLDSDWSD